MQMLLFNCGRRLSVKVLTEKKWNSCAKLYSKILSWLPALFILVTFLMKDNLSKFAVKWHKYTYCHVLSVITEI